MSAKFQNTFNLNCIMLKNKSLEGKHYRSGWDGSLWDVSSGSTVFVNSAIVVFGAVWVKVPELVLLSNWYWYYVTKTGKKAPFFINLIILSLLSVHGCLCTNMYACVRCRHAGRKGIDDAYVLVTCSILPAVLGWEPASRVLYTFAGLSVGSIFYECFS